ncbi:MAG: peptide chain release factor-like protein [Candidatus Omnitrophota bacterium]
MNFGITKNKENSLHLKMQKLSIKESDITEKFVRSGGKGGQRLNKVSTCVVVKHKPTGLQVRCQRERSQALNRFIARKRLVDKIEKLILGKKSSEKKRIEKIRRQKRKRSKRAKEKMLALKKMRSEKKQLRQAVVSFEE